jgi:hypothetical protein
VRDLVQGDPLHELAPVDPEAADGGVDVRGDEEQARLRRGVEQGELVLPEDAVGEEAEEHTDLAREHVGRRCLGGATQRAEPLHPRVQLRGERFDQLARAGEVGLDPGLARHLLGPRQGRVGDQMRVCAYTREAVLGDGVEVVGERPVRRLAGDRAGQTGGKGPIDHAPIMARAMKRVEIRAGTAAMNEG